MSAGKITDPQAYYDLRVRAGELSDRDPVLLRDTLIEIVGLIPELGNLIANDVDLLLQAPADQRSTILAEIAKFAAHREEYAAPLRKHAEAHVARYCQSFVEAFNACGDGKVLFVSTRPYFQILREAMTLRKQGRKTAIVFLAKVTDDITEAIRNSFDLTLELPENLLMLGELLTALEADLIHVQCWMHNYTTPLSRFVLEHRGNAKVVCEFYDLLSIYSDKSALERYDPDLADFNFAIDRYVWTHGDAFLVRAPEAAHRDLRDRYKFSAPVVEMHPYPSAEFIRYRDDENYRPSDAPRLVYAGSLMPRMADGTIHWPRYASGAGALAALESMLDQGLDVTVFHDPHKPLSHPDFASYFDIAPARGNLHLLDGVPPDRLSERIRHFDFGISLIAVRPEQIDVRPLHFKTAVGTKLFAYFEAGLPVIVSREYEYIAHIVESNGLGFAVHTSEFGEIAQRIADFDYVACVRNIKAFNERHSMEREIGRLTSLYDRLLEDRPGRSGTGV